MPSRTLRMATVMPFTCDRSPSAMASPAASSAARLTRCPVVSRSTERLMLSFVRSSVRWVPSAEALLMTFMPIRALHGRWGRAPTASVPRALHLLPRKTAPVSPPEPAPAGHVTPRDSQRSLLPPA